MTGREDCLLFLYGVGRSSAACYNQSEVGTGMSYRLEGALPRPGGRLVQATGARGCPGKTQCGADAVSVESGDGLLVIFYRVQAICQNILDRGEEFGLQSISDWGMSWSAVGVVCH